MSTSLIHYVAMADNAPVDIDPTTGKGPEWGKAAPVGLLVILLMGIATFFLLRSMTRKIKNVPASFDAPETPDSEPPDTDFAAQAPPVASAAPSDPSAGPEPGGPPALVDERSH